MGSLQQNETERKFDVDEHTVFPNLATVAGVASVDQPGLFELRAVYFDTPQLDLASRGITLRRRTGGTDEGWHLKLPARGDTRTEVREPLSTSDDAVPTELLARVRAIVRERPLVPVAVVSTTRREYAVRDDEGVVLVRVCDDAVRGRRLRDDHERAWREWEVELDAGTASVLDTVADALLASGASPASAASKLRRTLGRIPTADTAELPSEQLGKGTAGRLLTAHLAAHVARLHEHEAGLRAGHPEGVHRLRIAARRLRSSLSTFRPILDRAATDPVQAELRWLGAVLAPARDAQVLREHLLTVAASEPAELVIGPVTQQIDDRLRADHAAGMEAARGALDGDRYLRLLATLDDLVASPPLRAEADGPATEVLPHLLARDLKRLGRAVRAITAAPQGGERDEALHEARKKSKRMRYAAEAAAPALGKRARSLAEVSKRAQKLLGAHQDSVNARARLRELAVQVHLDGGNSFTFGRLHALEQARGERAEADVSKVWKKLHHKGFRN
ncbi:CYTH and CHAD domain-containing protein [Terrabacter terrigena]|uniref:CHAD domain-containing protein n=1 Tax=Terrabacter terrigena TaxID=574718 RepID=A0ABW3MT90_9MICO